MGPQTPTIAWSLRLDQYGPGGVVRRPALDRYGRLFVGNLYDLVCVDTFARRILWEKDTIAYVGAAPAIWQNRVMFTTGNSAEGTLVYCVEADTGAAIWQFPMPDNQGFLASGLVRNGVFYYRAYRTLIARRVSDGAIVWERLNTSYSGEVAADGEGRILIGTSRGTLLALRETDGAVLYEAPVGDWSWYGPLIEDGIAYIDDQDDVVALNVRTGQVLWRAPPPTTTVNGIALPHPETNQIRAHQTWHYVFGLDRRTGERLWTVDLPASLLLINPPIDAAGKSYHARNGWTETLFAVSIDGRHIWTVDLGEDGNGSSIIGPDGTLYVVSQNRTLFALRDPHISAVLTDFSIPQGARASGGLLSLSASDDDYFEMNSQAWFLLSEANLSTLELGAHTTKQNPTLMDIKVEARINQPVGRINFALKNWVTGAWETVEVQETRSNEDITYWKTGLDCRRYVRPDGRIELQIKTIVNTPITEATFRTFLDQVDIQIRDI